VVADGRACIDRFEADPAVVVLAVVDLTMPGATGVEVIRALRASRPDLPIVLTTGYDVLEVQAELGPGLPVELLAKPYRVDDLVEAARRAIGTGPAIDSVSTT